MNNMGTIIQTNQLQSVPESATGADPGKAQSLIGKIIVDLCRPLSSYRIQTPPPQAVKSYADWKLECKERERTLRDNMKPILNEILGTQQSVIEIARVQMEMSHDYVMRPPSEWRSCKPECILESMRGVSHLLEDLSFMSRMHLELNSLGFSIKFVDGRKHSGGTDLNYGGVTVKYKSVLVVRNNT